MTLTSLDARVALIVVDLQEGVVGMAPPGALDPVITHATSLTAAFRQCELPVAIVTVEGDAPGRIEVRPPALTLGPTWAQPLQELGSSPSDILIRKHRWGPFTGTSLHEQLSAAGVTQVVLAGVATSVGVESTARFAHELGYNVVVASDATADLDPESHTFAMTRIFPRLSEVDTTANILAALPA